MELYLIRHAQSQNNALPEPQRVSDPGITELGQRQALALGERLATLNIDVLLTSAFRRALETTRTLTRSRSAQRNAMGLVANDTQPQIWTDLFEQGGCYTGHEPGKLSGAPGLNRQEISREFPSFGIASDIGADGWWKSRPYESWEQAEVRAKNQVERLIREFGDSDQTIACVIHADFKALMIDELLLLEPVKPAPARQARQRANDLFNTGISQFKSTKGTIEMVRLNDASHLDDQPRS